jgi:hypothetical protein
MVCDCMLWCSCVAGRGSGEGCTKFPEQVLISSRPILNFLERKSGTRLRGSLVDCATLHALPLRRGLGIQVLSAARNLRDLHGARMYLRTKGNADFLECIPVVGEGGETSNWTFGSIQVSGIIF